MNISEIKEKNKFYIKSAGFSSARVIFELKERGLTLKSIGESAGVSRSMVSHVVAGRWNNNEVWRLIDEALADLIEDESLVGISA